MESAELRVLNTPASPVSAATALELAERVFAAKARRRDWLARLPVEQKYRRFLQLQRMVWETRRAAGKPCPAPWPEMIPG
ncbi:MAG: hypothetical protein HS113_28470 [Verrucomicrobiales bacterium]|nr:hypothetical protein [Verrucomicrobiales bacterium]